MGKIGIMGNIGKKGKTDMIRPMRPIGPIEKKEGNRMLFGEEYLTTHYTESYEADPTVR